MTPVERKQVEHAMEIVRGRMARRLCVSCAEPLGRDCIWWCESCQRSPSRCIICSTLVASGESRCPPHRDALLEFDFHEDEGEAA